MTGQPRLGRAEWEAIDARDGAARQALLAYAVHAALAGPGWHLREDAAAYVAEAAEIARAGFGDAGPTARVLVALSDFLATRSGVRDRDLAWSRLRFEVQSYFLLRFAERAEAWRPAEEALRVLLDGVSTETGRPA